MDNEIVFLFPRHWLLNAIPHIRTHASLKFLTERLLNGELTDAEASFALMQCLYSVAPDQKSIELIKVSPFLKLSYIFTVTWKLLCVISSTWYFHHFSDRGREPQSQAQPHSEERCHAGLGHPNFQTL